MARRYSDSAEGIWRERLRRCQRSGLTVARFCDEEGVSVASYYAWRRRLGERDAARVSPSPLFVPVAVPPVLGDLRIEVGEGVVICLPPGMEERLLRACLRAALDAKRSREGA